MTPCNNIRYSGTQDVEIPGGLTEEAMEAGPMAVVNVAAGEDDLGDVVVSGGEHPTGDDGDEGLKGWCGEDGGELE